MRTRPFHLTLLLCIVLTMSACGFKLRGSYGLPFNTLSISVSPTTELYASLKRAIEAGSPTKVVADEKQAEAHLIVISDSQQKVILSLNASGRAREYQLVRDFTFHVTDANNAEYAPASTITIKREITFNDDLILSKEAEEALIWRDIQSDLIQQLLRRLSAARIKPAAEAQ